MLQVLFGSMVTCGTSVLGSLIGRRRGAIWCSLMIPGLRSGGGRPYSPRTPGESAPRHSTDADPAKRHLHEGLKKLDIDLFVSNSFQYVIMTAMLHRIPCLEFGFPSHHRHALARAPFLGFTGAGRFINDMVNGILRGEALREPAC